MAKRTPRRAHLTRRRRRPRSLPPPSRGYAATKAIREIEALSQGGCRRPVPIVALSANAFEEDRRRSLEAGMDAHVAKPIKASALFDTLAEIL